MSGTMGYIQLSELTHEMENVLQEIRSHKISIDAQLIDALLQCVDILEELISDVEEHGEEKQRDIQMTISKLKGENKFYLKNIRTTTVEKKVAIHDFNEYEARLIRRALEEGFYIWKVVIRLVDECLLKSARAFLVLKLWRNLVI